MGEQLYTVFVIEQLYKLFILIAESDPIYGVNPITDHEIREMMGNM